MRHGPARATAYGWAMLAVSFALLVSDYMALQVLKAVFPLLKAEWGLTDARLGRARSVSLMALGLEPRDPAVAPWYRALQPCWPAARWLA
jgi:hypothetical protein